MTPQWRPTPHPHVEGGWTLVRFGVTEGLYVSKTSAEAAAAARNGGTK